MDSISPWDPASAQPVGLAWGPLKVTHLVGPNTVLLLIQAAQLLPLWKEGGQCGGLLTGVKVNGSMFVIKQEGLGEGTSESKSSEDTFFPRCDLGGQLSRSALAALIPQFPSSTPSSWAPLLPARRPLEGMSPTLNQQFPILCSIGSLRQTDRQSVRAWERHQEDQIPGNKDM